MAAKPARRRAPPAPKIAGKDTGSAERFAAAEAARAAGDWDAAEQLYRALVHDTPRHLAAWRGLASTLEAAGRRRQAKAAARKADGIEADNLVATAEAAYLSGRVAAASRLYREADRLSPEDGSMIWRIAEAWQEKGETQKALAAYHRYQVLHPDDPEVPHMVAALGATAPPPRASDAYVAAYFDRFAPEYDRQLVEDLEFRAPEHLREAVEALLPAGRRRGLVVLDLGCGTGLTGRRLRDLAATLDGVDLSPRMIARARRKKLYDALTVAEATEALADRPARYDLIVASDVLPYFGRVEGLFAAAAAALKPGGLFAFTVEKKKGQGHALTASGRYAHSPSYLRRAARQVGMAERSGAVRVLRTEYAQPVEGYVCVLERLPAAAKTAVRARGAASGR